MQKSESLSRHMEQSGGGGDNLVFATASDIVVDINNVIT